MGCLSNGEIGDEVGQYVNSLPIIFLIFSIAYVLIDTFKGLYNTAMIKIFLTIFFTFILNYLCQSGLGILSWLIIFIPFILMSVIITLLLFSFNLDPKTGKVRK